MDIIQAFIPNHWTTYLCSFHRSGLRGGGVVAVNMNVQTCPMF